MNKYVRDGLIVIISGYLLHYAWIDLCDIISRLSEIRCQQEKALSVSARPLVEVINTPLAEQPKSGSNGSITEELSYEY
jgi:hypothetical protein